MSNDSESSTPAPPYRPVGCAVGIDVGGTKIAGAVVEYPALLLHAKRVIPTAPERGGKAVLADALAMAKELVAEAKATKRSFAGIGVAVAELVDFQGGFLSGNLIDWRGRFALQAFARLASVVIEADSRAAALAEAMYGAGRPFSNFYYVTIGTGIGSCLVIDGEPYAGAHCSAGTLASSPMPMLCAHCGATSELTLEQFASGPALVARYNRETAKACTAAEEVLAAAQAGDLKAVEVVESGAEALGATLGLLVNVLDPGAVIVGGGLGSAPGLYWERLVARTRQHIWAETNRDLPILQAAFGSDTGVIGAATALGRRVGLCPPVWRGR